MYFTYSKYLEDKYGQKVYKIPLHIDVTCPNRDGVKGSGGCIFCSQIGAGFELLDVTTSLKEQLSENRALIEKQYKATKFIAYFQNFSNTYLPPQQLRVYLDQIVGPDIVEISLSTRPDCITDEMLVMLKEFSQRTKLNITIELGLQTTNDSTLVHINRGHDLAEFIFAVNQIKAAGFAIAVHMIPNLPWDSLEDVIRGARILSALGVDTVKLHSLYVLKDTELGSLYQRGEISICSQEEYFERVIAFLEHLDSSIAIQRFFGRAPQDQTLFCNWSRSWRYLQNQLDEHIKHKQIQQGSKLKWGI